MTTGGWQRQRIMLTPEVHRERPSCQRAICAVLSGALAALLTIAGCRSSSSGIEKTVVRGEVSYNGQPIENGQIMFFPIDGTPGPVSGAPISNGVYVAEGKGGVPQGRHRVQIEGYRAPVGANQRVDRELPRFQYVAEKYNTRSELTVEISDDESTVVVDFDLQL